VIAAVADPTCCMKRAHCCSTKASCCPEMSVRNG
jgi:hypothetical protein